MDSELPFQMPNMEEHNAKRELYLFLPILPGIPMIMEIFKLME